MPKLSIPESLFYYKNQFVAIKPELLLKAQDLFSNPNNDYVLNINHYPKRKRAAIYMDEETFVPLSIKGNLEINIENVRDSLISFACWDVTQPAITTLIKQLKINSDNYVNLTIGNESGAGHYTFQELYINAPNVNLLVEKITEIEKIVVTQAKSLYPDDWTKIVLKDLPRLKEVDLSSIIKFCFHHYHESSAICFDNLPKQCKIILNANASFNLPTYFNSLVEIYKNLFKYYYNHGQDDEFDEDEINFPIRVKLDKFFKVENNKIITTVEEFQKKFIEIFKNIDLSSSVWENLLVDKM